MLDLWHISLALQSLRWFTHYMWSLPAAGRGEGPAADWPSAYSFQGKHRFDTQCRTLPANSWLFRKCKWREPFSWVLHRSDISNVILKLIFVNILKNGCKASHERDLADCSGKHPYQERWATIAIVLNCQVDIPLWLRLIDGCCTINEERQQLLCSPMDSLHERCLANTVQQILNPGHSTDFSHPANMREAAKGTRKSLPFD